MEYKEALHALRRKFNMPGLTLIVYMMIMNVAVTLAMVMEAVIYFLRDLTGVGLESALITVMDHISDSAMTNAWGYLVACLIGYLILRLWKKKEFCRDIIWQRGKPMTAGAFFGILCIFSSGQLVFQVVATLQEWFLNLFGLSLLESMEMASANADSVSMFLYMGLFAPVFEEILFRGLILRSMMPYGKKFAILVSAVLFGVFHGNLAQSPYAFAVGLVLGYVAVEYSIAWAMVLHMFNNLILGDTFTRLLSFLPGTLGDAVFMGLIIGFAVAALIIIVAKRHEIRDYLASDKMEGLHLKAFFTAPANVVLMVYMTFNAVLLVLMSAIA